MDALLFYSFLYFLSFFPLVTILLAGAGLEVLLSRFFANPVHPEVRLARVVGFGIVWALVCFGIGLFAFGMGIVPGPLWSLLYFLSTIGLAALAWNFHRAVWNGLFDSSLVKMALIAVGVACIFQILSVLWFPSIMDAPQLGWTNRFTDPLSLEYGEMNGAVGYSGMIFFTSLLATHLPLAVSAASTKIVLYFLFILLTVYIARVFYGENFRFGILVVGVVLLGSSLGVILFSVGKDSIFGVVFTIFYVASLADGNLRDRFRTTALFCGLASCTGVISVPFLAVAALGAFLLNPDVKAKLEMAASHLILGAPLASFAAQAMAKVPFWYVALGAPATGIVLALLARPAFWGKCWWPRVPFWIPALVVLTTFAAGFKFLPYKLLFENFTSPFLKPLDGTTGFIGLLYDFNPSSGFITGFYILGPLLAFWLWRKRNPCVWMPFIYLPLTFTIFLIMCQSSLKLIDGPSQWTLIKNCITYFLPTVSVMAIGPALALAPSSWSSLKGFGVFLGVIFASSSMESVAKMQSKTGVFYKPHRAGVVQSQNLDTAVLGNYFWSRDSRVRLLIDESVNFAPLGDFGYFTPRLNYLIRKNGSFQSRADIKEIKDVLSASDIWNEGGEVYVITQPHSFLGMRDEVDSLNFNEALKSSSGAWILVRVQKNLQK